MAGGQQGRQCLKVTAELCRQHGIAVGEIDEEAGHRLRAEANEVALVRDDRNGTGRFAARPAFAQLLHA